MNSPNVLLFINSSELFELTYFFSGLHYAHRVTDAELFLSCELHCVISLLKNPNGRVPQKPLAVASPGSCHLHQALALPGTDQLFHVPAWLLTLLFMSEMFVSTLPDDIILSILQSSDQMSPQL